jgi:hypothetical protein
MKLWRIASAALVVGVSLTSTSVAFAAAPSGAQLNLRTGTLALAGDGTGKAPATVVWKQGSSSTSGTGCCSNDIFDANSSLIAQTAATSTPVTLLDGSVSAYRIDSYDDDAAYVGTAFTDPPGYFDGFAVSPPNVFTYKGSWHLQKVVGAYQGTVEYSTIRGASASLTFRDRAFELIMTKGPHYGSAKVTVNGVSQTVNLHAKTHAPRQIVLVRNYAENPAETLIRLKVTNLGTAGHPRVDINGLGAIETD